MIEKKRQTALEAVECLFYRVTIDTVEAPLNVSLVQSSDATHEGLGDYRGQLKGFGALLNFLTLISKNSESRKAKTSQSDLCRLACVRFRVARFSGDEASQVF